MPRPKTQTFDETRAEKTREAKELIIRRLKTSMRLLGFTNREIERRLGYTPSYLTRLLSGEIELRFEHIVEIASAMGMTAEEFFQFAYPARQAERSEQAIKLDEMLEELRPGRHPEWTNEEIVRAITKLFDEHIDKFPKVTVPEPPKGGVHLIRDSRSSSKRSGKSQSRKR